MASSGAVNTIVKYGVGAVGIYLGYSFALAGNLGTIMQGIAVQIQGAFSKLPGTDGGGGGGGGGACSTTAAQLAASLGVSVARVNAAMAKHSRATPCDVRLSDFDDTPEPGGGGGGGGGAKICPFIPGNRYVAASATGFQLVWRGRIIEDGVGQTKAENDYNEYCQNDYY